MGWLWSSNSPSTDQDGLDPSLREFLAKAAPTGPKPVLPSPEKRKSKPVEAQSSHPSQLQASKEPTSPAVPPQSQFQDGRYAHLWQNYAPQDVIENRGKNDQDRLRDLIDGYNDRRASVGRKATENCALEYMEQFECFRHPKTWWARGTSCNAESRRFNRCYDIQSKFLKALGYMTMDARSPDEDERIQMHADKLYQQMLQQEAEIAKAKEEGRPIPKFGSVLSKQNIANAIGGASSGAASSTATGILANDDEDDIWKQIKPASRAEYEKKLARLPPEEQEVEKLAVLGEIRANTSIAKRLEERFVEERIHRIERKEAGQATFGDRIKTWWGWDR
ncbi:hypothetical protein ACN47E_000363 [Coniothyrium glycines]